MAGCTFRGRLHVGTMLAMMLLYMSIAGPAGAQRADIETISRGERVDVGSHLVKGKYVLFSFYADWCGACRSLAPQLDQLASQNSSRLALRKINIRKWGTPAAKQFQIRSIPHLKLYGPDGRLVAEGGPQNVLTTLERGLASRALPTTPSPSPQPFSVRTTRPTRPAGRLSPQDAADETSSRPLQPGLLPAALAILAVAAGVGVYVARRRRPRPPARKSSRRKGARRTPPSSKEKNVRRTSVQLWFVELDEGLEGPFSLDELEEVRRSHRLGSDVPVKCKGDPRWRRLGDVLPG